MKLVFEKFLENITLTPAQNEDAKTKYTGVCKTLYHSYYDANAYDDGKKYLFGSYKTKTNVRPLTEDQDVDVLFKIPEETFNKFDAYESNGQEALLQEVRNILSKTYKTTDTIKAWGKVVLVKFAENHHNIELLPALEQEDSSFLIPNSEDGGSWEVFNPREQIDKFQRSNEASSGLTRDIVKALKTWVRCTYTLEYASYRIVEDVISFLDECYPEGADGDSLGQVLSSYFTYWNSRLDQTDNRSSHFKTAKERADKALDYAAKGNRIQASKEWRKIFGNEFPLAESNSSEAEKVAEQFYVAPKPWGII